MPLTKEQKEDRKTRVGSSDMAALLGVDPFKSAYDVWLAKTGKLDDVDVGGVPIETGIILEPAVLDEAERRLGPLLRDQTRLVEGLPLGSQIDALVKADEKPVEAKTGQINRVPASILGEYWGDEGTDQMPDRVIIQGHVHMMAVKSEICYVPALIGDGKGFRILIINRKDTIITAITERVTEFWDKYVLKDVPPAYDRASLEVVKHMIRQPGKVTKIDPKLITVWKDAKDAESAAKKDKEIAQADILAALGKAEAGIAGALGAVTFYEYDRKGYTVAASKFRRLYHRKDGL